jgi:hypothetical protein
VTKFLFKTFKAPKKCVCETGGGGAKKWNSHAAICTCKLHFCIATILEQVWKCCSLLNPFSRRVSTSSYHPCIDPLDSITSRFNSLQNFTMVKSNLIDHIIFMDTILLLNVYIYSFLTDVWRATDDVILIHRFRESTRAKLIVMLSTDVISSRPLHKLTRNGIYVSFILLNR